MLKWIFRAVLFRTVLRRFWPLAIIYAVARRFMPREQSASEREARRRGYS